MYNPNLDQSLLTTYQRGQPLPNLTNAEDSQGRDLLSQSRRLGFVVQPLTPRNTILSLALDNPLEGVRYQSQQGVSPNLSVDDDYLDSELSSGRRPSISSAEGLSVPHFGVGSSTPFTLFPEEVNLSPHPTGLRPLGDLWIGEARSSRRMSPSTGSTSSESEPGSNVQSLYTEPMLPISNDSLTGRFYSNRLVGTSLPSLSLLRLIPAASASPNNHTKLGFMEILRQQVAQRRAESPWPSIGAHNAQPQNYDAADHNLGPSLELGEEGIDLGGLEQSGGGANSNRNAQANFECPVPGCNSTFTRKANLCVRSKVRAECQQVQSEVTGQEALAVSHSPKQCEGAEPEKETGTPAMRATKRQLEGMEENNGVQGEPKRSKIIYHDYADVFPNHIKSASHMECLADKAMRDVETDDQTSDTPSTLTIQSGQITCEEMFQHLVDHGCTDLSSNIDPGGYLTGLIQGGAFGDIWKGKLRDGTEVAIKVWRFSSLLHNGSKSMKQAMREIYYWSKAKHEYVQELMGVIMFQGRLGMVSLWMDHCNLREYICKNPNVDRYPLCLQVASGIAYLHSREMVHGDLKGTNILVLRRGVAKLSDFDHLIMSECSIAFLETSKLGGGTTQWMAPELILDDNCTRSAHTDIYALGMTMLEIITGSSPYSPQCKDDVNVIKAIMKKQLPAHPMDCLGDNLRNN